MTTVFFKGLGLIGSSLAQAIKLAHPDVTILASDPAPATIPYARQQGWLDAGVSEFERVAEADFIFLASPVDQIVADLKTLATHPLKPGVIVTDVGSTKQAILTAAAALADQKITFIGGHPMAGLHKSGVTAGRPDLFENAFYFQVPLNATAAQQARLQALLVGAKVKWLTVTAATHDAIVAQISHLPHIIAAALVNQTKERFADQPLGMRLAAGGFKSVTRIAAADPTMWTAILLANAPVIRRQLADYIAHLQTLDQAIATQEAAAIHRFFAQAKHSRDQLNAPVKAPFYDLFLNLPDQVGALAAVTGKLATAGISITNIQLLEVREDINGILQLTFSTAAAHQAAQALLATEYELIERR